MKPAGHEDDPKEKLARRNRLVALGLLGFAAMMIILTLTLPPFFAAMNS